MNTQATRHPAHPASCSGSCPTSTIFSPQTRNSNSTIKKSTPDFPWEMESQKSLPPVGKLEQNLRCFRRLWSSFSAPESPAFDVTVLRVGSLVEGNPSGCLA